MPNRRYTDEEMAEIFRRATETRTPGQSVLSQDGRSLEELQSIGQEAGIPAADVARAALSLDHQAGSATERLLRFPIGVSETAALDRRLSDDEWDQLVVAARQAFKAKGRFRQDGAFRQWSNGNLAMLLEPTPTGHRLVLRTHNANARVFVGGGVGMTAFGVGMTALAYLGQAAHFDERISGAVMLLSVGVAFLGIGALRLPSWARQRREQFRQLIERARGFQPRS